MENMFGEWLKIQYNVSDSTIGKYKRAIRAVSKDMNEEGVLQGDLYNISSFQKFESVKSNIFANDFFVEKDTRGHRMYSAALNWYSKFLSEK